MERLCVLEEPEKAHYKNARIKCLLWLQERKKKISSVCPVQYLVNSNNCETDLTSIFSGDTLEAAQADRKSGPHYGKTVTG